jgi:hypothetical protein
VLAVADQLTFSFVAGEPTIELRRWCACGRELHEHIEHYRAQCCMCILRSGAPAHEDPAAKRAHLRGWLAARGCVCTYDGQPHRRDCPIHWPVAF